MVLIDSLSLCIASCVLFAISAALPQSTTNTTIDSQDGNSNAVQPVFSTCSSDQRRKIRYALGQLNTGLYRSGTQFEKPIFKLMSNRASDKDEFHDLFRNIVDLQPMRDLNPPRPPTFVCVTEEQPHVEELGPEASETCLHGEAPIVYQAEEGDVFICPYFFDFPVAPANKCPEVKRNKFVNDGAFPQGQDSVLLWALIPMYRKCFAWNYDLVRFRTLNGAIGRRMRPIADNLVGFLELTINICNVFPDVNQPPWAKGSGGTEGMAAEPAGFTTPIQCKEGTGRPVVLEIGKDVTPALAVNR